MSCRESDAWELDRVSLGRAGTSVYNTGALTENDRLGTMCLCQGAIRPMNEAFVPLQFLMI